MSVDLSRMKPSISIGEAYQSTGDFIQPFLHSTINQQTKIRKKPRPWEARGRWGPFQITSMMMHEEEAPHPVKISFKKRPSIDNSVSPGGRQPFREASSVGVFQDLQNNINFPVHPRGGVTRFYSKKSANSTRSMGWFGFPSFIFFPVLQPKAGHCRECVKGQKGLIHMDRHFSSYTNSLQTIFRPCTS